MPYSFRPPVFGRASNTCTSWPLVARRWAQANPAGPAPITATVFPVGAAKTIFDQNILGGICARVCPTETLCEEACVREAAEGQPVKIGLLQRYATDKAMSAGRQFYKRAAPTGKTVAVIGAGPAGLA